VLSGENAGHFFGPAKQLDVFAGGTEKGGDAGGYLRVATCTDGNFPVGLIGEGGGELGSTVQA
jgi:hypothetical protein